jgi:succinate dehydrogenase/fumarate reductase flavoprotein subunit
LDAIEYAKLSEEAYGYLQKAEACFGTPIARLAHMNTPAIELYAGKGVDITKEYLEIALCAQHNNGGIAVDLWWQTEISGLYAAGECAGTHGIARPGGSALNAGQVGALRAATHISASSRTAPDPDTFAAVANEAAARANALCQGALKAPGRTDAKVALDAARRAMSDCAAAIRDVAQMKLLRDKTAEALSDFDARFSVAFPEKFVTLYRLRDTLTTQLCMLGALLDYAEVVGLSRGSSLYTDEGGTLPAGLEERFRFAFDGARPAADRIQTVRLADGACVAAWRPIRPLPAAGDVFELVWQGYRENGNVY